MLITTAQPAIDVEPVALNGTIPIGSAAQGPPYRALWYLDIAVPAGCESVSVDHRDARLRGRFRAWDMTIDGADLDAVLSNADGGVRLELPGAWWIRSIDCADSLGGDGRQLHIHRYDGAQVVSEASLKKTLTSAGTAGIASKEFLAAVANLRVMEGDTAVDFDADDISSITVRCYPSAARLSWALADETGTVLGQPLPIHVVPGQVSGDAGQFELGAAAAQALGRLLKTLDPVPGSHRIALLAQSDVPFRISWLIESGQPALRLRLRFAAQPSLPPLADGSAAKADGFKHTVRFAGAEVQEHCIELPLPAATASATMCVAEHLQHEAEPLALTDVPPQTTAQGARLDTRSWVAVPVAIGNRRFLRGLSVSLLAMRPDTRIRWRLEHDRDGVPDGAAHAAGAHACTPQARPRWQVLRPVGDLDLEPAAYWLLLQALEGEAIWQAQSGSAQTLRLDRASDRAPWRVLQRWDDSALTLRQLRRPLNGAVEAQYTVTCGGLIIPREVTGDGQACFSLDAGIAAWRAAQGPFAPVPLCVSSMASGLLTLYAPELTLQ